MIDTCLESIVSEQGELQSLVLSLITTVIIFGRDLISNNIIKVSYKGGLLLVEVSLLGRVYPRTLVPR